MSEAANNRLEQIFSQALALDAALVDGFLDRACGDDEALKEKVKSLLAGHRKAASSFLKLPTAVTLESPRSIRRPAEVPPNIGRYAIDRVIGRGGMGVVYLGVREDGQFRRNVAVKVLKRGMDTEDVLRRFELERQLLAALNHPGVARLYDAGETDEGLPYFVMEYIEGLPIDDFCDNHRLPITERLELFRKVCLAVHYAHQNLVVHRDLKPSNILINKDGQPKLLDFGIAKLVNPEMSLVHGVPTAPERRVMTPEYASPEQARGDPITTASDIYTLGVLLYELMTGHRPYRLPSRVRSDIERVICEQDPERPSTAISLVEEIGTDGTTTTTVTPESVSKVREGRPDRLRKRLAGDIDNIVLMAMRKEPQRRYSSAEQFAEDIRRHMDGRPVIARADTVIYRCSKFVMRHRAGVAATIVVAIAMVGGIIATTWQAQVAARERDKAEHRFDQVRELARTFIYDFDEKIKSLEGSLPARELLVTKALDYLDSLAGEAGDDPDLMMEVADAYKKVGDVQGGQRGGSLGDTSGALESYQKALATRKRLHRSDPEDTDVALELADDHARVGDILRKIGETNEALSHYRAAFALREKVLETRPGDANYRQAISQSHLETARVLDALGDSETAEQYVRTVVEIREQLAEEYPGNSDLQRSLTVALNRLGQILKRRGDLQAALEYYGQSLRVRERLAQAEPDNSTRLRDVGLAHYWVGGIHEQLGDASLALHHYQRFLEIAEKRAVENVENARAANDLAVAYEALGSVQMMTGDFADALETYRRFQSRSVARYANDPENLDLAEGVARSHSCVGDALAAMDNLYGAIASHRQSLEVFADMRQVAPHDVQLKADHAIQQIKLARLLLESASLDEAIENLTAAQQGLEEVGAGESDDVELRAGYAEALHQAARYYVEREDALSAKQFANRALEYSDAREPEMLRTLARASHLAGDTEAAIAAANEAISGLDSVSPEHERAALLEMLEADLVMYSK